MQEEEKILILESLVRKLSKWLIFLGKTPATFFNLSFPTIEKKRDALSSYWDVSTPDFFQDFSPPSQVMQACTDVKKNVQRKRTSDSFAGVIRKYIFMKK